MNNRWELSLLSREATIREAIDSLNTSTMQIVLVVDSDRVLVGTITDGDIRRGLIDGHSIQDSLTSIANKSPVTVCPESSNDQVIALMRNRKISQIPIVDSGNVVVGLHTWANLFSTKPARMNSFFIFAGGKGRRLKPFTNDCPKPMLDVAGKPILLRILERAKSQGFQKFIFAVNYLGEQIENFFRDGGKFGVDISYVKETTPLGTAGALSLLQCVPTEPIVVTNGDILADVSYDGILDFHKRHRATVTIAVGVHESQNPYGVVRTEGLEVVGLEEKPITRTHVSRGIYIIEPSVIQEIDAGIRCDMPDLIMKTIDAKHRVIVYSMSEPWLDIGRPSDLEEARYRLS